MAVLRVWPFWFVLQGLEHPTWAVSILAPKRTLIIPNPMLQKEGEVDVGVAGVLPGFPCPAHGTWCRAHESCLQSLSLDASVYPSVWLKSVMVSWAWVNGPLLVFSSGLDTPVHMLN